MFLLARRIEDVSIQIDISLRAPEPEATFLQKWCTINFTSVAITNSTFIRFGSTYVTKERKLSGNAFMQNYRMEELTVSLSSKIEPNLTITTGW